MLAGGGASIPVGLLPAGLCSRGVDGFVCEIVLMFFVFFGWVLKVGEGAVCSCLVASGNGAPTLDSSWTVSVKSGRSLVSAGNLTPVSV